MTKSRRHRFVADAFRRLLAAGGIALVLGLAALTASPDLHRWVHGDHAAATDDNCAVVQFAHGVAVTPDSAVVASGPAPAFALVRPDFSEVLLTSPRALHPPGRGPPAS